MNFIHCAWRLGTTESEIPRRERGDIEEEEEKGEGKQKEREGLKEEEEEAEEVAKSVFSGGGYIHKMLDDFLRWIWAGGTPSQHTHTLVPPPKQNFSFPNLEWLKKKAVRKMLQNTQTSEEEITLAFPLSSLPSYS